MSSRSCMQTLLAATAVLAACSPNSVPVAPGGDAGSPTFAMFGDEWSEPVLLDAAVNSPFFDIGGELSPDKLTLYFASDRPVGGFADLNIWVARRDCLTCPWQPAQPLPAPINGPDHAGTPTLSRDGHLLFWSSDRLGSVPLADGSGPSQDIWMARRQNPTDDFGWGEPVHLESPRVCAGEGRVNTVGFDASPSHVVAAPGAYAHLYFGSGLSPFTMRVTMGRSGEVLDCAVPVTELGQPTESVSVRADGRELLFWAPPARGGLGGADLWVSTRTNVTAPWSTPANLGPPVNTSIAEVEGSLSHDGTTLVFSSGPARGGLGFQDIWIATRTRGR